LRKGGVEPPTRATGLDPKSSASANSATFALSRDDARPTSIRLHPAASFGSMGFNRSYALSIITKENVVARKFLPASPRPFSAKKRFILKKGLHFSAAWSTLSVDKTESHLARSGRLRMFDVVPSQEELIAV
jgi:hypothetical protein